MGQSFGYLWAQWWLLAWMAHKFRQPSRCASPASWSHQWPHSETSGGFWNSGYSPSPTSGNVLWDEKHGGFLATTNLWRPHGSGPVAHEVSFPCCSMSHFLLPKAQGLRLFLWWPAVALVNAQQERRSSQEPPGTRCLSCWWINSLSLCDESLAFSIPSEQVGLSDHWRNFSAFLLSSICMVYLFPSLHL
jgi:hypothetical protein